MFVKASSPLLENTSPTLEFPNNPLISSTTVTGVKV